MKVDIQTISRAFMRGAHKWYQLAFRAGVWGEELTEITSVWMYIVAFVLSNRPRGRDVFALYLCWIHASLFISTLSTDLCD